LSLILLKAKQPHHTLHFGNSKSFETLFQLLVPGSFNGIFERAKQRKEESKGKIQGKRL